MWNLLILDFLIFKIRQIGLFWSKITIIIIEISLKLHLKTKYEWNYPNSRRLGLKSQKLHFFAISGSSKIHITHKHSKTCHGSIFIINWFFLNAPMSSIRINNNWNYQKIPIIDTTVLLTFYTSGLGLSHSKLNWLYRRPWTFSCSCK